MDFKSLQSAFSSKIIELRKMLHFSAKEMADCFNACPTTYRRYEQGKMFPAFTGLYSAASQLEISLDWLVCGKGPVYYKDKDAKRSLLEATPAEITELLEHMNSIPLLRYEVLAFYHKFKADHKELVPGT